MITLIGFRCTHRKVFSQEVLIDRVLPEREWRFEYRNNLLFVKNLPEEVEHGIFGISVLVV